MSGATLAHKSNKQKKTRGNGMMLIPLPCFSIKKYDFG